VIARCRPASVSIEVAFAHLACVGVVGALVFHELAGVTDLRPRRGGGDFLYDLRRAESRIVKKAGGLPLRLYAVGGNAKVDGFRGLLTRRYFGGAAHDLIVTLASAMPASAEQRAETTCNHFDYFRENQIAASASTDSIRFLTGVLAPPVSQPTVTQDAQNPPPKASLSFKPDPVKVAAAKAAREKETQRT